MTEHRVYVEHSLYLEEPPTPLSEEDGIVTLLSTTPSENTTVEAVTDDLVSAWESVLERLPMRLRAALYEAHENLLTREANGLRE